MKLLFYARPGRQLANAGCMRLWQNSFLASRKKNKTKTNADGRTLGPTARGSRDSFIARNMTGLGGGFGPGRPGGLAGFSPPRRPVPSSEAKRWLAFVTTSAILATWQ
jgi:hypothetical protein